MSVQVVRGSGTNIQGDLITISGFVDTAHVAKAIGTGTSTIYQIAAAHRSVADSGEFRCYAFWHSNENEGGSVDWTSKYNYVDTGGNLGLQADFVRKLGIASRAFDHNGRVYVHGAFAGESEFLGLTTLFQKLRSQLQNTYFLYRDDAFLVAKVAAGRAGGFAPSLGRLPGVALTSGTTGYSWCATERRIIPLGTNHTGYDDRGPRDVTYTFDSNEARRCARLGQTLYITGGEILQYDGVRLVEVGVHVYPWFFAGFEDGVSGSLEAGTYAYKATLRWDNARGERDRSTTATHGDIAVIGAVPNRVLIQGAVPLYVTHKTANAPAFEIWRTLKDPNIDSPFYLVTAKDPAVVTNPNRYLANDPTLDDLATVNDELADATLISKEANDENGAILENVSPPPASIIIANDSRLFLAGVAGDPNRVWYSQQRRDGQVASFHDGNVMDIPREGGDITSLAFLSETLVVFRETAIYALPGDGYDNFGSGQNFGPARIVSLDVGAVNHESVAFTPGGLVFKSSKGWYLLTKGFAVEHIGGPVSNYDSETPLSVQVVEKQHQIRILTSSKMLVFDYLANQWAEWTIADGLHAAMWSGAHAYLTSAGPKTQSTAYTALTYGLDVETAWIKPADLQGGVRIRKMMALGEFRSAHNVRVRVAYDYLEEYVDDFIWTNTQETVGGPEQVQIGPSRQRCQAIKVRLTALAVTALLTDEVPARPTGEALKLTGLALEVGQQRGFYRRLSAAQKAGS
ncbi:MAG: hypothetical protein H0V17_31100 [Deltaproteobacteria bacterium]|nr:hypothetical protein [Deltaproteobacteria bacterium]